MSTKHTKIIIIEGPDNCGKDTLINKLKEHYNDNVSIIHASAPPKDVNLFNFYYDGFIHDTLSAYYVNKLDAVIHNRSMYGEYIYGAKYRGKSKADLAKLIYNLEVGQLKTFIFEQDLFFILLNSSNIDLLVNNDDGLSISNKRDDIADEINAFNEIFNLSTIKNKKCVYINSGSSFRDKTDIYNEVINYIEGV